MPPTNKHEAEDAEIAALEAELKNATEEQAAATEAADEVAPKQTADIFEKAEAEADAAAAEEAETTNPTADDPAPAAAEPVKEEPAAALPAKQDFVPQQALHAAREKKRESDEKVALLEKQLAELKGHLAGVQDTFKSTLAGQEPAKKEDGYRPPTQAELNKLKEENPIEYVEKLTEMNEQARLADARRHAEQFEKLSGTVTENVSAYQKEQERIDNERRQQAEYEGFVSVVKQNVSAYAQNTPGYAAAYNKLREARVRAEMMATGATPHDAVATVDRMELQEANAALMQNRNPASYWHGVSLSMYPEIQDATPAAAPAAAAASQTAPLTGKPSLDTVAAGQAASTGLSGASQAGAGVRPEASLEAFANLSEADMADPKKAEALGKLLAQLDSGV